ncbi:damage-inducible protein DinB [Echinicola soli]|uniref:Damage-inducible protein DinB n=1 Tax=Echinicola soli TaxID=2591634 RepID=A0A514CLB6_9BACT|nr:DinB family protein [Echinicola soli]QDH80590.1 damage-inducible protein DinB [Echinicola soli]
MEMIVFFKELFDYVFTQNQRIIQQLRDQPDKASERSQLLLSHIVNAHHIWNAKIIQSTPLMKPWDLHSLEKVDSMDRENLENTRAILSEMELDQEVPYRLRGRKTFHHPVGDLLFQVVNHTAYHRGQIATEFRKCGMEPIMSEYIVHKMTGNKKK